VGRLGLGHPVADLLGGIACVEKTTLGGVQPFVGGALLDLELRDGGGGLRLPFVELRALVARPPAIERQQLATPGQPAALIRRARELGLVADDGLLVAVEIARRGVDGGARLRDGRLERAHRRRDLTGRVPFGGHPLAQLPDLALRGEDAARFCGCAAEHEVRALEDIPVHRRDQRSGAAGRLHGLVERLRDPRLAERPHDDRRMGTRRSRHVGERAQPLGTRRASRFGTCFALEH
jgi:hypothetical protein